MSRVQVKGTTDQWVWKVTLEPWPGDKDKEGPSVPCDYSRFHLHSSALAKQGRHDGHWGLKTLV